MVKLKALVCLFLKINPSTQTLYTADAMRQIGLDGSIRVELWAKQDETVGNASTVLAAGAGVALLQDFGAESSAAGALGLGQSSGSPFELLPAEVSQDGDDGSLPDDSEE